MKNLLYIFIGGGAGSIERYFLGKAIQSAVTTSFPVGILIINILASFIVGAFIGSSYKADETWRALIAVGFCGGFSTFSTFSNDTLQLMLSGRGLEALGNILLNVSLCLLATYGGILISR